MPIELQNDIKSIFKINLCWLTSIYLIHVIVIYFIDVKSLLVIQNINTVLKM